MSPSGSKEDRRVQTPFPHLSTPGEPGHDYDTERRSAAENREHRRIVNDFRWVYIDAATAMVEVIPVVKCRARHAATFIAPKAKATYALPWRGLKSASEGAKWHFSRLCGILCSKKLPSLQEKSAFCDQKSADLGVSRQAELAALSPRALRFK